MVVPVKVHPSRASTAPRICSHDHCAEHYGGCEHCPYCSTTPPLPAPVEFATQAAVVAETDPLLQRLNKSLQDTIARVHRQNGGADERDLKNDYAVQRQRARVFAYKQRIGLEPPAKPDNTMELILRIPTRIQVFRVRNKGYYCHAIALLCGPPVQPHMVSVLEEVSTGALFSSGRMLDVKFRVACPYLLVRKRVLGLLGDAANVQTWKQVHSHTGDVDDDGNHWSKCMDAQLTSFVLDAEESAGSGAREVTLNEAQMQALSQQKSLVFEREYIASGVDGFWWQPKALMEDMNDLVDSFVYIDDNDYNENQKMTFAATEPGKKRMYQEKKSELATDHAGDALLHKWDNREYVTRENVNFTRYVKFKRENGNDDDIDALKDSFLGDTASRFMKARMKPRMHQMRRTTDIQYGVWCRSDALSAMNAAIEFLRREYLKRVDARNVEFVHMSYPDVTPVHWEASGLTWKRITRIPEKQREITDGSILTTLDPLKGGVNDKVVLDDTDANAVLSGLENDHYFPGDDPTEFWIQVVEGDERSAVFDHGAPAAQDENRLSFDDPSLFEEARDVVARILAKEQRDVLEVFEKTLLANEDTEITLLDSDKPMRIVLSFLHREVEDPVRYVVMADDTVDAILHMMCRERGFDFAHEEVAKTQSSTLVLPVGFFEKYDLGDADNVDGAVKILQNAQRTLSSYSTVLVPGRADGALFFAHVSLKEKSTISAYAIASGRELRNVREDLQYFINECLRNEYGNDHASINQLRGDQRQRFYKERDEWRCARDNHELLLLAWVAYFCDGRAFDFEPGDREDMDNFRAYFALHAGLPCDEWLGGAGD